MRKLSQYQVPEETGAVDPMPMADPKDDLSINDDEDFEDEPLEMGTEEEDALPGTEDAEEGEVPAGVQKKNRPLSRQQEMISPYVKELSDKLQQLEEHQTAVNQLREGVSELATIVSANGGLRHPDVKGKLRSFIKSIVEAKRPRKKRAKKEGELDEAMVKFADKLEEEKIINAYFSVAAKESKEEESKYLGGGDPKNLKPNKTEEKKYPDLPEFTKSLSHRYCPDHYGVSVQRIGDSTFQCPLDNKIYNWNQGFTDYNGGKHSPSKISTIDTPSIVERPYENRQQALSKKIR